MLKCCYLILIIYPVLCVSKIALTEKQNEENNRQHERKVHSFQLRLNSRLAKIRL